MSQDQSPIEAHDVVIIPVEVINDDAAIKTQNLEIESREEVYYPTISFANSDSSSNTSTANEPASLTTTVASLNTPKQKRSVLKIWRSKLETLAVSAFALFVIALVGTKIAGFKAFTVVSGSMEPKYPVGSIIYVKPTNYKTLKVGDVISYVANSDKTIVTHRIVDIETDKTDPSVIRFKTQGDANKSPDAKLVHYKNVLGTPIITVPYLGYIVHKIQQPPGIYIALVVGTLLLAWTFLPGTLEERRKTARKSVA